MEKESGSNFIDVLYEMQKIADLGIFWRQQRS